MLRNYLLLSWKILSRRKFFTFISLFGVALTLVVLMVATTLLDQGFGAIAPEINADRTLGVYSIELRRENSEYRGEVGYAFLDRHVRTLPDVEAVTIASSVDETVTYVQGTRQSLRVKRTDAQFWNVLSFNYLEGGPFTAHDESEANPVAVISEETRRRIFGRDQALGKSFELDGRLFRVVGVVSNVSLLRPFSYADVWVPLTTAKNDSWRRGMRGPFQALVLAHSKKDLPRIQAEYAARLPHIDLADGIDDFDTVSGAAESQFEHMARMILGGGAFEQDSAAKLRLMLALAALLFMSLPSLNMININVSRILERASEIGVRKSFGASGRTLVGQFVVENLLLTAIGSTIGFVITLFVLRGISGTELVAYAQISMNLRVFAYGLLFTVVLGLLSGTYPAWKMSRLHPVQALKESAS